MKRFTFRFIAMLFAFIVGISLTSFWILTQKGVYKLPPSTLQRQQQITFDLSGTGTGPDANYYYYKASDGVKLMRGSVKLPTPARANEELQYKLQLNQNVMPPGRKVLERGPKQDTNGQVVGERAVATFGPEDGHQLALVVWTNGEVLNWIESPSLYHVLELEKIETSSLP
jgi:hypothetical protein